jgi:DNA polymerase
VKFYDFEVFKYDWLVVILDMDAQEEHVIINDPDRLKAFYEVHKDDIWCGYNNVWYDQYILKAILLDFDPKAVNDFIIDKGEDGWRYSNLFRQIPLISYDVMLDGDKGLKSLEGFMGNNIKESDVDFNIDCKLTPAEIAETVKYCRHDVEQTVEVFMKRIVEFETKMFFIKHFKYPLSDLSKTKAQLAAKIIGANRKGKTFDDEFQFPILDCLELKKYKFVADWYKDPNNHTYSKSQEDVMVAGVPHTFSWGGGHGARSKFYVKGAFLIIDVTAYYPSLQEEYKFGYRVMDNPENFEFIHNSNIEFKKKGDKKARQPFKIMDNAISGQMKQKSSALYDPMSNNSICVNGQLSLLDLVEHLEPYCQLIQNNTDGIIVRLYDYDRDFDTIDDIVSEWESRTGMAMEFETFFGEIYQKDVNNYLLVDRETGTVKRKGAYIKALSDLDNDLPIVNKALVNYMVNGVHPSITIKECDNMMEFQMVRRISKKYSKILYGGHWEEYQDINPKSGRLKRFKRFVGKRKELKERCVRVFASTNDSDGGLWKVKGSDKIEKLEGTPEHSFIINDDVKDMTCPPHLDKQWYIKTAISRLKDFGVNI